MQAENHLHLEDRWQHTREPALLAASGGAVDTISFITLFGLFTAHVTGNLVVAGASLADNTDGILAKLLAIPVFMVAVAATTLLIKNRSHITPTFLAGLFLLEILFLLLFGGLGYIWSPFLDAGGITTLVTGMTGVIAMGIRNATSRLLLASTSPSTMMTGNVTQLTIDLMNWLQAPGRESFNSIKKSGSSVLGFLMGAGLGTLGYIYAGFFSVLIPILMILYIAVKELIFAEARKKSR
ncbi:YoaK family protein [Klebsiella aerogenes]|uniref:YoaK family protein n=1 Tax=Klebsiella aerogenes TaxID=548 RepID=UPI003D315BE6